MVLLLVGMFLLRMWEEDYSRVPESTLPEEELTYFDGGWYRLRRDVETVLLMGIDKATLDEAMPVQGEYEQSDFLMLLVIDKKAEKCTGIHINRDTMTEIQMLSETGRVEGRFTGQITLAHSFGGQPEIRCRNAVTAVSHLLYGMRIDHYISIMMDGVIALNDLVGGVTLEVMDDFTGIDDSLVQGEMVTLMGQQALTYIRARKGLADQTNLHRMERQKQYLAAYAAAALEAVKADITFPITLYNTLSKYMVTDVTVDEVSFLAPQVSGYRFGGENMYVLSGSTIMGERFEEFHVDEEALYRLILEVFYEEVI